MCGGYEVYCPDPLHKTRTLLPPAAGCAGAAPILGCPGHILLKGSFGPKAVLLGSNDKAQVTLPQFRRTLKTLLNSVWNHLVFLLHIHENSTSSSASLASSILHRSRTTLYKLES